MVPPGGDEEVRELLAGTRVPGRRRKSRYVLITLAVILVAAAAALCSRRAPPPRYQTAAVERGTLQVEVTATGTVQATSTVEVGAEVTGRAIKVLVDFNDKVTVGQLLVELDPEAYRARVREAEAQVAAADAAVEQATATQEEAKANLARALSESSEGLLSTRELDAARAAAARAKASRASARAQAELARASLSNARTQLEKTRISSPIEGIVLSRKIDVGQTVTAGFTTPVLFELAEDLSRMALHVMVDEADVGSVREGQRARFTVDAYSDRTFESKVLSLRNQPTTVNNVVSYEAILEVENGELLLRPGMTANATIVAKVHEGVLLVPDAALRFQPPATPRGFGPPPRFEAAPGVKVWTLEQGALRAVPVKRGAGDGRRSEVTGELAPGTLVVTDLLGPGEGAGAKP